MPVGMFTELVMAAKMRQETPIEVIQELKALVGDSEFDFDGRPFRWERVLRTGSYAFDGDAHSTFRFDDIVQRWILTVRSNHKVYRNEIEMFLDWIAPHVDPDETGSETGFVGYMRYEEASEPTLIYMRDGKVRYAMCSGQEAVETRQD